MVNVDGNALQRCARSRVQSRKSEDGLTWVD